MLIVDATGKRHLSTRPNRGRRAPSDIQEKYRGPETNRGEAWKVELKVSEDEVLAALGRHFLLVGFRG